MATDTGSGGETTTASKSPAKRFLNAKQVGETLDCSWRHVLRMADQGLMPWGVKLGSLRRWDSEELNRWIASGCRPTRKGVS